MFRNLYKQGVDRNERQEIRRRELLRQQKLKRIENQDNLRHNEDVDVHKKKRKPQHKKHNHIDIESIDLQFSEWLREKPENLGDWLLVPCPKGKRCIVVATKGETKMFSKNKKCRMKFSSLLPGGGFYASNNSCILDCIYNKDMDTFFVLDALHLIIPLLDCDTEFRFFWLKSKFNEISDRKEVYKLNNYKKIELLFNYDMSDEEGIAMTLQNYPVWPNNKPELDGFLFYHKHSHYVFGITPLVCWLFPFMLPDILHLPVSRHYEPPSNYCRLDPLQYMDAFNVEMSLKQLKYRNEKTELTQYESCSESVTHMEEDAQTVEQNMETDYYDNIRQTFLTS